MFAKRGWTPGLLFSAGMFGICAGYCSSLAFFLSAHRWILTSGARPVPCDFLAFWAAGRAALVGKAMTAYDPNVFHTMQTSIAGPFPDYLFWNYPPVFFFAAALLASAPYLVAFLGWVACTSTFYAIVIATVARRWEGALAACASPVFLLTAFGGQNGFLTAALLGGVLLFLPRRPVLSGVLLGFLTYKPQLGVLIPVALVAGGHWRALCSAMATVALAVVAAALVFGPGTYSAFFHSLPVVTHVSLALGGEGWAKMQSVYAIVRFLGGTDSTAWFAQGTIIAAGAATMVWLWRSDLPFEFKAAGLALTTMLSTPYLHVYDFPLLLVPLAFLYRQRAFDHVEWYGVGITNLLLPVFLAQVAPIGPGIILLVGVLIARRAIRLGAMPLPQMLPAPS